MINTEAPSLNSIKKPTCQRFCLPSNWGGKMEGQRIWNKAAPSVICFGHALKLPLFTANYISYVLTFSMVWCSLPKRCEFNCEYKSHMGKLWASPACFVICHFSTTNILIKRYISLEGNTSAKIKSFRNMYNTVVPPLSALKIQAQGHWSCGVGTKHCYSHRLPIFLI